MLTFKFDFVLPQRIVCNSKARVSQGRSSMANRPTYRFVLPNILTRQRPMCRAGYVASLKNTRRLRDPDKQDYLRFRTAVVLTWWQIRPVHNQFSYTGARAERGESHPGFGGVCSARRNGCNLIAAKGCKVPDMVR